jgi:hypothetical protein
MHATPPVGNQPTVEDSIALDPTRRLDRAAIAYSRAKELNGDGIVDAMRAAFEAAGIDDLERDNDDLRGLLAELDQNHQKITNLLEERPC